MWLCNASRPLDVHLILYPDWRQLEGPVSALNKDNRTYIILTNMKDTEQYDWNITNNVTVKVTNINNIFRRSLSQVKVKVGIKGSAECNEASGMLVSYFILDQQKFLHQMGAQEN